MQQIVPEAALSASLSGRNATDDTIADTICVIIGSECSRWYQRRHYLRQYRLKMQQMVPEAALSASILQQNAPDSSRGGTICVTIGSKCSRWYQRRHYLRHYRGKMQQMVSQPALSASLSGRNATDDTRCGTICVTIGSECSRWYHSRHYLRHYRVEMQQIVPGPALSASISAQNAADGTTAGTICVTIAAKRSR